MGLSSSCGIITSNVSVELQAIYNRLLLAWNEGSRDVICESDSQLALKIIPEAFPQINFMLAPIVHHINKFKTYVWKPVITHTLREGNSSASLDSKECGCFRS